MLHFASSAGTGLNSALSGLVDGNEGGSVKKRKTKSRNGCARCKSKRLKCDETSPACFQCRKRNVKCPGYERTLKWSTKYEVFRPIQLDLNCIDTRDHVHVRHVELPPDIVSGLEALAKVLPASGKGGGEGREVPKITPEFEAVESTDVQVLSSSAQEPGLVEEIPNTHTDWDEFESTLDALIYSEMPLCPGSEAYMDATPDISDLPLLGSLEPSNTVELSESDPGCSPNVSSSPRTPLPHRSLLLDYYRVPITSPACSLADMESRLVQHYFKEVCVLFSSFDSSLNPFRTTIGRIFQECSSIYYAIQSMAAAHLANTFPEMTEIGKQMQHKACDSLYQQLQLVQSGQVNGTMTFLSIVLLGMTTSWHESSALGEDFLLLARSMIVPKLICSTNKEEVRRETQFFEEALIYWEMLMGFVAPDTITCSSGDILRSRTGPQPDCFSRARYIDGKIVPHPWTGIAPSIQLLFAEVGRLIRKERISRSQGTLDDALERTQNLINAQTLEEDLLSAEYPAQHELADPGDARTPRRDFLVLAEAYRCAGLLELYRIFPSLLRRRLGTNNNSSESDADADANTTGFIPWTQLEPALLRDAVSSFSRTHPFSPPPRFSTPYETTDTTMWLNSLALHILSLLSTLPATSGTCCLQPILFVTAASELRLTSSIDYFDVHGNDGRVLATRRFVEQRMAEFAFRLPDKPVRRCIDIVREVWKRADAARSDGTGGDVFWVDVVVEKGWQTVMG